MIHTAIRWGIVALLLPLLLVVATTPSNGQFLDLQIIANQAVQIGHQITNIQALRAQLTQLQEQGLGRVGALAKSLKQLSADPTVLLDDEVPWALDFQAPEALRVFNAVTDLTSTGKTLTTYWRQSLANADQVHEADFDALYPDDPDAAAAAQQSWREKRDDAERKLIGSYAVDDTAEELLERLTDAQESLDELRNQTNMSGTALQQALLTSQLTNSTIQNSTAQLAAFQAIQNNLDDHTRELARRRSLGRSIVALVDNRRKNNDIVQNIRSNASEMDQDLLFPIHP